jgi:hypothetical protein
VNRFLSGWGPYPVVFKLLIIASGRSFMQDRPVGLNSSYFFEFCSELVEDVCVVVGAESFLSNQIWPQHLRKNSSMESSFLLCMMHQMRKELSIIYATTGTGCSQPLMANWAGTKAEDTPKSAKRTNCFVSFRTLNKLMASNVRVKSSGRITEVAPKKCQRALVIPFQQNGPIPKPSSSQIQCC